MRVENKSRRRLLLAQQVEQAVNQCRFASSHLAREQNETLAGPNPVSHFVKRLLRLRRQEQIPGIRIDVEGIFAQFEEMFVHVCVVSAAALLNLDTRILTNVSRPEPSGKALSTRRTRRSRALYRGSKAVEWMTQRSPSTRYSVETAG